MFLRVRRRLKLKLHAAEADGVKGRRTLGQSLNVSIGV